jgi:hypothetical protein
MLVPDLQIPEETMGKFTFVHGFHAGGSVARTFLVKDKGQRPFILKYADWDGIGYNGTPWVETQTQRLIDLRKLLQQDAAQYLPIVYEVYREENVFYAIIEYFKGATTVSEYYLKYDGELIQPYLFDINRIITLLATYFYNLGTIDTPKNYIQDIHINRVKYRLSLFHDNSETFKRYVENKEFSLGNFKHKNMAEFFKTLFEQEKIIINGKEYTNALTILQAITHDSKTLAHLTPAFLPRYTHGDSLLRNYLRTNDGDLRIIDLRGNHLPTNTPSEVCIPYDLGKILHSIGMDIVRSNHFKLEVHQAGNNFKFTFKYNRSNKNTEDLLKVREKMLDSLEHNEVLGSFINKEPNWREKSLFAEACHFLSDSVNRLEQDHTGKHSLAYYLIGTILLNDLKLSK